MQERNLEDGVRTRLILSGIGELCVHGIADFSLRRVALAAEVSCAAPYRHFKDKDELILEIIRYIFSKWQLLSSEIESIYRESPESLIIELAAANVAFWAANGNFRSVLMLGVGEGSAGGARAELQSFDAPVISAISAFADSHALSDGERRSLEFFVTSLIYGTVMLITTGKLTDTATALKMVRATLRRTLSL